MEVEEAVERFRRAAKEKADFAEPARRDHQLHREMSAAWRALEKHGQVGREAFKSLLADESPHVRCWVASQLLGLGDDSGLSVLEASAEEGGFRGFSSEMVISEWRAGRLRPPLG